ncbi:lipid A deacylase LpxR family protein [Candidatus Ferrigenium straubiae]|uniref:lipid A deacylase LpxR family protein n=1 Tax=Candidatus Ferrigenium straubiae TaxID=2919506 RepID=UPI003F4AC259
MLVLLWAGCSAGWAEPVPQTGNRCETEKGKHLLWENDVLTGKLFGRSDKWYTNGFKFYGSDKRDCIPDYWLGFLHDWIGELRDVQPDGNPGYAIQTGHVFGQLMFTPKNLTTTAPQLMDRFWGGWLYGGIVVQRQPHDSRRPEGQNRDELETLELDVGVTGPLSGAEQVQRVVHALSNSTMPAGWGNQIKTEPGMQFSYTRIKRVWKYPDSINSHLDFSWHYGGAAGTLFDYVNGGATFRFGGRLTDAAPNVIESPSIGQFRAPDDALYLLARLDMKGVAHNAFIDGSLLRGEPHASHLSSKRIVPQLTFGGVAEWKYNDGGQQDGLRLSLLIHRRGSEFRSPAGPGAIFNFATLNVEWDL